MNSDAKFYIYETNKKDKKKKTLVIIFLLFEEMNLLNVSHCVSCMWKDQNMLNLNVLQQLYRHPPTLAHTYTILLHFQLRFPREE